MGALHNVTGAAPTLTDTARALAAHPRLGWMPGEDIDLADPALVGVLLGMLLDTVDPRITIAPGDIRVVVTDHAGARCALSGTLAGDVLARGLLCAWGS